MPKLKLLTSIFSLMALSMVALPAVAEESILDRAGFSRTLVFNVTAPNGSPVFRATVTCENGQFRRRKRTDETGTAPISLKVVHHGAGGAMARCLVQKGGYEPVHKLIDLYRIDSVEMVSVGMSAKK